MQRSVRAALAILCLLVALHLQATPCLSAQPLPPTLMLEVPERVWCGDPFLIRIADKALKGVKVQWLKKTLSLTAGQAGQKQGECVAMLATGLEEKAATLPLEITVRTADKTYTINRTVRVGKKDYPVQKLAVPPKYVSPPKSEQARIERERATVRELFAAVTPEKMWNVPFIRPVPGEVTSEFGLRREFNGQKRNPHRGLDLDGFTGDPILAACDGVVMLRDNHYYSGNLVIVDHGLGVFTTYMHLSDFAVRPGQHVRRGDVLGYVGSTGRVTGPHLHLSLSVQGLSVNPQTILEPAIETTPGKGSL